MEVSAIVNSPAQQKKQAAKSNVLRSAIGGAGIGAALHGFQAFSAQKQILKNGDVYLKEISEKMAEVAEPAVKEQLQGYADKLAKFIEGGKVDLKAIGKSALKGAAMCAAVFAGVELISSAIKKGKAKKAQPKQV